MNIMQKALDIATVALAIGLLVIFAHVSAAKPPVPILPPPGPEVYRSATPAGACDIGPGASWTELQAMVSMLGHNSDVPVLIAHDLRQ